jgi:hypothetical protein
MREREGERKGGKRKGEKRKRKRRHTVIPIDVYNTIYPMRSRMRSK